VSLQILIADDHGVVRRGLRAILESRKDWRVCGEATNGIEAVEMAKKCRPTVAVVDISMSELNGVEATRRIQRVSPTTEVLILSMHESDLLLRQALEAGARGYMLKDDADRNLLAAVETVCKHERYFSPKIVRAIQAGRMQLNRKGNGEKTSWSRLTPREREVVQLLAEGKSNKEAAAVLNISAKTVETHRARIMLKLDLHSITDLVRYAIRNHIVKH